MSKLKIGYLTKRRDACWWLRILNPMSYLNLAGHETTDEVFEKLVICPQCAREAALQGKQSGQVEVQYNHVGDYKCPMCSTLMVSRETGSEMTADAFESWRASINQIIDEKDIICFQRPTDVIHLQLIREAKRRGKKTVQICDDDYLNVPDWNSGARYYYDRQGTVQETLRIVDALDVTTPYLVDLYSKFNKKIALLPNSLDVDLIDLTPPANDLAVFAKGGRRLSPDQFQEMRHGKKFFLWGGSPTHQKDLDLIVSAMRRIVRGENVCLGLVGYVHWPFLEVIPADRLFLFSLMPCMSYFMGYKAIKADVGLAPVFECDFNRGKSPLKALEYQALGVLPVMSDFDTYRGCSPQGIYSKSDEYSWYCALRKAVHCEDLEGKLKENKAFVEEKYNIKNNISLWENFYQSLL